ncbi:uncharacterized protein LOC126811224 [Patella vulgata]|uniref:uncharacterized protein LOC126811224 n=1 Tax=Patella vulgata TaxID=6465 RepID=UPI0021803E4F|nr:uncharacterized protein LOC126811224 [Patella vulgata]
MSRNIIVLFVLIYISVIQDVKAAHFTITPSQSLQPGARNLTLRCSPASNSYTTLYDIRILKRSLVQNSLPTPIAEIDGNGIKPGRGLGPYNHIVTGNYDRNQQPTESFLQVIINDPNCDDSAEYQCITHGSPTIANDPTLLQEDKNVTVYQSKSSSLDMDRSPERMKYGVGDRVELSCYGYVGYSEKLVSWESKSSGDLFFDPITENITLSGIPPRSPGCEYFTDSIYQYYYVGKDDNGLQIRCKVDNSEVDSVSTTIYLADGRLTITPSNYQQIGYTSLTIRCSPGSNSYYTTLYDIRILKHSLEQNSLPTVMAEIDGRGIRPGSGIISPKYTVTGNYDINQQPTESFLEVIINNLDCPDRLETEYQCIISGSPTISTNPALLQYNESVTVGINPGSIEITRYPEKMKYDVGEKIDIICQGDVGYPEHDWNWCSNTTGHCDLFYTNITNGQVEPPTSTRCGYYSRSTFSYYVGKDYNGLEIRCMVNLNEMYSVSTTIYLTDGDSGNGKTQGTTTGVVETTDDIKKRWLLADIERIKLEQEKLKLQISRLTNNTTNCNCGCN